MDRKKTKDRLEELRKATDDWKNNKLAVPTSIAPGIAVRPFDLLRGMSSPMKNFERDKNKDVDANKRLLGTNKREHDGRNYNKGRKKYNKDKVRKYI
jgi:hypothetical protein